MPQTLSLNGDWSLAWHDDFPQFLTAETAPLRTQLTAHVPEPVHAPLNKPEIALTLENGTLTLRSEVFVWGVCLDLNGERPVLAPVGRRASGRAEASSHGQRAFCRRLKTGVCSGFVPQPRSPFRATESPARNGLCGGTPLQTPNSIGRHPKDFRVIPR